MKKAMIATALCCGLLVPSSAWAYSNGTYKGTTSQGLPVSFKVKSKVHRDPEDGTIVSRRAVDRLTMSITVFCEDGFQQTRSLSSKRDETIYLLGRSNIFTYSIDFSRKGSLVFNGTSLFGSGRNSRARGRAFGLWDITGHPGCSSEIVRNRRSVNPTWTAHHV